MSVLYNRLKGVEKEKKPDVAITKDEEFPIDSEIKRQKEERGRRNRLGIMTGIITFALAISIGLWVMSSKKGKLLSDKGKQLPQPQVQPLPPPTKEADASLPPEAVEQTEPTELQTEELLEDDEQPPEALVEVAASSTNLLERGTKLYKQNRYSRAATAYMEGLQQDPQQTVGYNNLGVVYCRQGKLQKALVQLKLAVELNPQYPEAHYNLAVVLEKLGQDKQALFHYLKFLRFAPSGQQTLQEMVQAHVRYYY